MHDLVHIAINGGRYQVGVQKCSLDLALGKKEIDRWCVRRRERGEGEEEGGKGEKQIGRTGNAEKGGG